MHIHIGATSQGKPVKITASKSLNFKSIVRESLSKKGLDMISVVDCASFGVLSDIRALMADGELYPLEEGGLIHRERLVIIPASEVETTEKEGGSSHHISYFPSIKTISDFARIMSKYVTNMELSSQKARMTAAELYDVTSATGGVLIPAHAFTPHKSLYGNAGRRLREVIDRGDDSVYAIELGLSADTNIADHLSELENVTFLSNSDAHSIEKIGREYNIIEMEKPNFQEFILALKRRLGRRISANVGIDPRLGRYHRTFCPKCSKVQLEPPPVFSCRFCGAGRDEVVPGVLDRIKEIADKNLPSHPAHRPPYRYQIPLSFVPGINDRIMSYLLNYFGTEMAILNVATDEEIKKALNPEIAKNLIDARSGRLKMTPGGGGRYGRVYDREVKYEQLTIGFN